MTRPLENVCLYNLSYNFAIIPLHKSNFNLRINLFLNPKKNQSLKNLSLYEASFYNTSRVGPKSVAFSEFTMLLCNVFIHDLFCENFSKNLMKNSKRNEDIK